MVTNGSRSAIRSTPSNPSATATQKSSHWGGALEGKLCAEGNLNQQFFFRDNTVHALAGIKALTDSSPNTLAAEATAIAAITALTHGDDRDGAERGADVDAAGGHQRGASTREQLDAIRGMLPCDDPQCSHPIVRVDLDNRGSFVLQRACRKHPQRRVWWSGFGPLQRFPTGMVGMIDKAAYEARALRKCGLRVFLCSFHVYAAVLEKFDKDLRIRHGPTLFALIIGLKWLARSRTHHDAGRSKHGVRLARPGLPIREQTDAVP